jgi:hypothetical protein
MTGDAASGVAGAEARLNHAESGVAGAFGLTALAPFLLAAATFGAACPAAACPTLFARGMVKPQAATAVTPTKEP